MRPIGDEVAAALGRAGAATSDDERDQILSEIVYKIEFYQHARDQLTVVELEELALERDALLARQPRPGHRPSSFECCDWTFDAWVPPDGGESELSGPDPVNGPGPIVPHRWKPAGGVWTSPLRESGSSPWQRYVEHRHPGRRARVRVVGPPGDVPGLRLSTVAEATEFWGEHSHEGTFRWRDLSQRISFVRFSWNVALHVGLTEVIDGRSMFGGLSVCSTLWLRAPHLL